MNEIEERQRSAVVAEALSWRGTPYHHMGRVKGAGVDCAMFPAEVYHAAMPDQVPAITPDYYPMDWAQHRDFERYEEMVLRYARRFDGPPASGDLVLWRYGRTLSHGAIVVAWPRIIHSANGIGVTLDDGESDPLNRDRRGRPRERRLYTLWGSPP